MWSKIRKLSLRILFIPVSGLFAWWLLSLFGRSLNDIFFYLSDNSGYHLFLRFDTRDKIVLWLSLFWMISLFFVEIIAVFLKDFRFRRLLTNLRYAPFFILIFSMFTVIFFDLGMIEYSKWRIRDYVYNQSERTEKPDFHPHVDYRGWCGNGYTARESYLYFDAASEGITSENPKARTRAFLMTLAVRDFFNRSDAEKMSEVLRKICQDSDFEVKNLAEEYLADEKSSCQKLLSSK